MLLHATETTRAALKGNGHCDISARKRDGPRPMPAVSQGNLAPSIHAVKPAPCSKRRSARCGGERSCEG